MKIQWNILTKTDIALQINIESKKDMQIIFFSYGKYSQKRNYRAMIEYLTIRKSKE
jgi:hypothetical protein